MITPAMQKLLDANRGVQLLKQYAPRRVLHLGAGPPDIVKREVWHYEHMGVNHVHYVEANPELEDGLAVVRAAGWDYSIACLSDTDGDPADLLITPFNLGCSSLLQMSEFLKETHRQVRQTRGIKVQTIRLETLLKDVEPFDTVVSDLQGYDLIALEGFAPRLHEVETLMIEECETELYENSHTREEVEEWMLEHGFVPAKKAPKTLYWYDRVYRGT